MNCEPGDTLSLFVIALTGHQRDFEQSAKTDLLA